MSKNSFVKPKLQNRLRKFSTSFGLKVMPSLWMIYKGPSIQKMMLRKAKMADCNEVTKTVSTVITAKVLEDIDTPVCNQNSIELPLLSPTIQFLNTKETHDFLLFPLPFATNDIHVPSEPTSQIQDPPNVNKIISSYGFEKTTICFKSTYLSYVTNAISGRFFASLWWIETCKWQLKWKKSTKNIGSLR